MTYEEAVAEKKRREAAKTAKPVGTTAMTYDQAIAEKQRRAAEAQRKGETGVGMNVQDAIRTGMTGLTMGGSDYFNAGVSTLARNALSSVGLAEDVDFNDALRQQKVYNAESEARLNDRTPAYLPAGTLLKGAASVAGPGKVVSGLRGAKAMAAPVIGGVVGGVNAYLNDGDWKTGAAIGATGGAVYPLARAVPPVANLLTPPLVKALAPPALRQLMMSRGIFGFGSMAPAAAQGE